MPTRKKIKKKKKHPKRKSKSEAMGDRILRIIHLAGGRWLTTNEISKKAKTSWSTASIYLSELFREGYLQKGETKGGLICWKENE